LKKFKTIFFYVFVIAALGGAVWAYFYLKQTKKPSLNALDVLPEKAICVLAASDFHELANKLTNQNLIWNELGTVAEFKNLNKQLQYFDSLTSEVETIKEFFENRQIFLALYQYNSRTEALITFNLRDLVQEKDFVDAVEAVLKCEVNDEGECEFWNGTIRFYLKTANGVVVLSENKELTLNCFSPQTKKQAEEPKFKTIFKNLDNDDLFNVYINHNLWQSAKTKIDPNSFVLNGSSVCNIEISPDAITANGFNDCDSNSVLNYISGQPAQNSDFFQALPFNTIRYKAISIGHYSVLKEKLRIDQDKSAKFWKQANDSALFNVERQLNENINTKLIEADYKINDRTAKVLAIEIKDSALVKEAVKYLSDSLLSIQNNNVYRLNSTEANLAGLLFGELTEINAVYAFVYGNYLFLHENPETAMFYLSSLVNNSSFAQNEMFMNYAKDNLLVSFNYQWYSALNKNNSVVRDVFSFVTDSSAKAFNKLSDASINIVNYKNLLQFRANVKYQSASQNKDVPGLWTCEADTFITGKPWLFVNHKSNENELIFQDANNNLYLVNATGNILWKKPVGAPIISDVYTVDAFKNNKFQILFSTTDHLHLIDRNGNYVQGFPVKLPASATNPLTLLDYDNSKDYRIIMACSDNRIYNYYVNGTKNEKFTPIRTDQPVVTKVKYAKVGASDYIIANDREGKIYVYSRRGEGRIDLSNKLITDNKDFYVEVSNNIQNTKLYYFDDKNSLLESINLMDKKDIVKVGSDFESADYSFELIDDDKKMDIVILDKTKLICYDLTGNELFRYESTDETYKSCQFLYDSDGAYFILTNANDEIHILEASTKKITKKIKGNNTPLVYDLFKDGKKYLMVSEGNLMKCVLIK
jgi:hypothetical protein